MNECDKKNCTLHVCTSCRPADFPREPAANRPGFRLYQELSELIDSSIYKDQIELIPTKCLSLCLRPCGIALSSKGSWTYLFGDQDPENTSEDILECIKLFLSERNGFLSRSQRPKSLRSSILGRIPPKE